MSSKFVLFRSTNNNQYYWSLKAPNGERIAHSEGYTQKQSALNGVASVKRNAAYGNYTVFLGRDNQYYWNLKAPNNEIIARSEGYTSRQGANNGIASVKRYAPLAAIQDLTATAAA